MSAKPSLLKSGDVPGGHAPPSKHVTKSVKSKMSANPSPLKSEGQIVVMVTNREVESSKYVWLEP